MKNLILILLISCYASLGFAQQADSLNVSKLNPNRLTNVIDIRDLASSGVNYWEDKFRGHWAGVHLGVNGFLNEDYTGYPEEDHGFLDIELHRSTLLDINLIQFSQGLQRNRNTIGLVTGFGLQVQTFYLDQNTSIEKASRRVEPINLFFDSNQKSKLSSAYLTIPFLAEFQIPIRKYANRLYVSTGVQTQIRLKTHTKIKYRKNNKKEKLKTPDDFYMRDIRCSAMVRMGYRWINLFASYDLRPLFKDHKGPELYPFTAGLTLLSF